MGRREVEQFFEFPGADAWLVAYRDARQKINWYLRFVVPGPDRRYNPGESMVFRYKAWKLIDALERACEMMAFLEKKEDFVGTFSETLLYRGEVCDNLAVAVSGRASKFLFWRWKTMKVHFMVSSKTNTFDTVIEPEGYPNRHKQTAFRGKDGRETDEPILSNPPAVLVSFEFMSRGIGKHCVVTKKTL